MLLHLKLSERNIYFLSLSYQLCCPATDDNTYLADPCLPIDLMMAMPCMTSLHRKDRPCRTAWSELFPALHVHKRVF